MLGVTSRLTGLGKQAYTTGHELEFMNVIKN